MPEQIHLGFGIDKNFGKFAGITITSLVHNNIEHDLIVHIVYDELLQEDMEKLLQMERLYRNLTLRFYQITSTEGMTFVVPPGHITQAMYYRYLFADMLPETVTRLIYMDADIICKGDILPLWQLDLQGKVLAAARDYGEDRSCDRIGLKNGRYFNSGVLLMDLKQWREQKLTTKLFQWLEQVGGTKILWGDQDALNGVIDGEFVELPKIFNCIVINNTTLNEDLQAVIVHYIDYVKPWHSYYVDSNAKELYWQYVKKSLWSDLKPQDGKTVQTVMMTARLLHKQGKYAESASYYEALLKYFLKEKYE
ncbi:glycosyltransferase family 8 protein [uncultured Phascolarctobacterium sp.]|uniref:glycosyltransferase family 8 protein n=1 Tax=uncultured Phascolarctobacterium sp. TaxID=512296 RepID=UPI00262BB02B|nr:glycosyltransferase family 8 protein [uncultured Phascolarctobacterium sp.]